jgi:hypothetical protein
MATSVIMPALELAQETGKVIRWLKAPGDAVVKGEPLSRSRPTRSRPRSRRRRPAS